VTFQQPPNAPHGAPQPYGAPPHYPFPPAPRPTNAMAVAALICGILFAPLGIVFGHISLSQIKRTGEEGRGLAIAGLVMGYVLTALSVVMLVALVLWAILLARLIDENVHRQYQSPNATVWPAPSDNQLPAFNPPANLGANCAYAPTGAPTAKPVKPPRAGRVPTQPALVSASMATDQGNIGIQLDNAKSPCTVNNFASLAQQGYFDGTPCHRLTTAPTMRVLHCGDPTGTGSGGPGYRFANEYPTNQYRISDPALRQSVVYPRGTLAMANTGPGTNGSQFFLVYGDSQLPPTYTVFGVIDATGLATVDKIAAGGVVGGGDGKPVTTVTIKSVRLD
jgi:peptidyl-prolyl cis-trans isomerase B (cyclophilin B)